jgi:serine/threonine protein kinase
MVAMSKTLRKKTEDVLLSKIFADYSLVTNASSNNGFSYVLSKSNSKTYVKVVDKEQEEEEGFDEAELARISSSAQNVIKLVSTGDIDDKYKYLQFEYIEGNDLSRTSKPASADDLLKLAKDITLAISGLWAERIVHRDIKPGNIMHSTSGYTLVDLGIGYYMEAQDRDNTKAKGSRYYSSPEQFFATTDRRVEVTFSSDMYSLGMVLFELASGSHPKNSWSTKSCYGEVITQTPPPQIEEHRNDLSKELTAFINKSLAINPSDRFLTPQQALDFLDGVVADEQPNRIFLHDSSSGYKTIDTYLAGGVGTLPGGVVVGMTRGNKRIQDLKKRGVEVLVDPLTYRLPHPLSSNSKVKKGLGYKKKVVIDSSRVQQDIDSIIDKVLIAQGDATSFILPYFAIETVDDNFVAISKQVWREGPARAKAIDSSKKVYGGLVIASSIIKQAASVDRLINLLFSQYPVDGFYVIFEAPDDKPKTIDSQEYLQGVQKITSVLKSMGKLIIGYADTSYVFAVNGADIALGWSNSKRRFLYSHELKGEKAGFLLPEYDPKLLYYVPALTTFIKGEDELESIYKFAPSKSIDCLCNNCSSLLPYDGKTPKDLELAELHYYKSITDQVNDINSNPRTKKREVLRAAADIASEVSRLSSGVGSKTIPSHETILAVINQ